MAAVFSELVTLMLMAFALGMDAFSVGLGMGMLRLRLRQMIKIGLTVGFFHIWMPLLGIFAGRLLSEQFGAIAGYIGGGLLIMLGMQMIWAGLREQETAFITPVGIGLFLFALGVSLDSFSVGLTLGIYGAKTALVLACFGAGATIPPGPASCSAAMFKGCSAHTGKCSAAAFYLFSASNCCSLFDRRRSLRKCQACRQKHMPVEREVCAAHQLTRVYFFKKESCKDTQFKFLKRENLRTCAIQTLKGNPRSPESQTF